jgi:hypothetical protein
MAKEQAERAAAEEKAAISRMETVAPVPAIPAQAGIQFLPESKPSGPPTLHLGQINEHLAPISLTADGLAQLGFQCVAKEGATKLYHEKDFREVLRKYRQSCLLKSQELIGGSNGVPDVQSQVDQGDLA